MSDNRKMAAAPLASVVAEKRESALRARQAPSRTAIASRALRLRWVGSERVLSPKADRVFGDNEAVKCRWRQSIHDDPRLCVCFLCDRAGKLSPERRRTCKAVRNSSARLPASRWPAAKCWSPRRQRHHPGCRRSSTVTHTPAMDHAQGSSAYGCRQCRAAALAH